MPDSWIGRFILSSRLETIGGFVVLLNFGLMTIETQGKAAGDDAAILFVAWLSPHRVDGVHSSLVFLPFHVPTFALLIQPCNDHNAGKHANDNLPWTAGRRALSCILVVRGL